MKRAIPILCALILLFPAIALCQGTLEYGKLSVEEVIENPKLMGDDATFSVLGLDSPGKGIKRIAVVLRLENDTNYWIFPYVMPGYLFDGDDWYREEGDALINNTITIIRKQLVPTEIKETYPPLVWLRRGDKRGSLSSRP